MGWASCYEDNMDARGESKRSKSRKPKSSNRKQPIKETVCSSQENPACSRG